MKPIISLLILLLFSFSLIGQGIGQSKLYDKQGRLIADSTLRISKIQLKKWTAIEDTVTKLILHRLVYPQMQAECDISAKVIISFTLDPEGKFNDLRLENDTSKISKSNYNLKIGPFSKNCISSIKFFSGFFAKNGFKAKEFAERYYLPFDFIVHFFSSHNSKQIKNGWLTFELKVPELIKDSDVKH